MAILNTVADMIVYTPLVIIGLTVLYGIGYGIWHYKTRGRFPPSYEYAGSTFMYVLKQILKPLKWLGQLLWWLIPVFPDRFREPLGYSPLGAWERNNITRTLTVLFLAVVITITALVYRFGYPNTIIEYSQYLNGSLLILAILGVLALFIAFNNTIMTTGLDNNPWPMGGPDLEVRRREWVTGTTSSYLYYSIGTGLALGLLFTLFYFIVNYGMFSVTGTTMMMIGSGLLALFLIYKRMSQNPTVQRNLRESRFLSNLFYIVFIIPCLFGDTVKYLFNQFRHTPRSVYMFLGAEIAVISLYMLIPIIQKYFYTMMPGKDDKVLILTRKIQSIKKNQTIMKERIKNIKNFNDPKSKSNLPKNIRIIDDAGWKNIISNDLNNPSNEEKLTNFLINYGYTSMDMCKENPYEADKTECAKNITYAIKYIQEYTLELVGLQVKLKDSHELLKTLEEEKRRINTLEKSKILLMDPVYLKNKKYVSDFETEKLDNFDIDYNYNYAISGWFFLRANSLKTVAQSDNYRSILNYGGKPNILYSSIDNKLKIKMNNGRNQKPKIFVIDNVPLQKWNNIVINYDGGILDIFMNSKLLASYNNIVPYMSQDQITIGDEQGLSGGICNVVYFPQSISKDRIDINYKILSNKNPPVI